MALVTVNDDENDDFRSRPPWSAGKKQDVVLRLLRGESLDELSRELGIEAHRIAAWRDDFLAGGKESLKGQRGLTEGDQRLREAERKIGELTMDVEVWRRAAEKRALRCRRRSGHDSRGGQPVPGQGVSDPRRPEIDRLPPRARGDEPTRPGPRTEVSDDQLLAAIRAVLGDSPFCGEGYRKVRARLRREKWIHTSGKRVLRLMPNAGLLPPQRARRRRTPRLHDGTIIPAGPN